MKKKTALLFFIFAAFAVCLPSAALAATTTNLPYASGLSKFTDSLVGMAPYISLAAFFAAGVAIMIGGEMAGWVKQMVNTCLVVGTISGAKAIYDYLFGASGFLL